MSRSHVFIPVPMIERRKLKQEGSKALAYHPGTCALIEEMSGSPWEEVACALGLGRTIPRNRNLRWVPRQCGNMWRVMGTRRETWSQHGTELVLRKYLWDKDLRRNNSKKNTQILVVYWDYIAEGLEGQVQALSHYISFASWIPITAIIPCSCWEYFPPATKHFLKQPHTWLSASWCN